MCVYSFFMLRDKFTTEKCVLCGVNNRLFCLTGRFRRKRCSRRPGSSRRDGELLLLTEIDINKLMCSSLLRTNVFCVWHWREREVVLETRDLPDRKESGLVCLLLQSTIRKKMAIHTFTYNALHTKTLKERIKTHRKIASHSNSTRAMLLV